MDEYKWYIGYTYPKAERKVFRRIKEFGVETFLPLHKIKRKWSDRIKEVEMPLFPNYIFVKTMRHHLSELLTIDGLSKFISFGGETAVITERELETINKVLKSKQEIELSNRKLKKGQRILFKEGALEGLEGILVTEQGKERCLIEIEGIGQILSINLSTLYIGSAIKIE